MRKRYRESRIDKCPFCGKMGVIKNNQGVPVCINHKGNELKDLKCVCGEWLDIKQGKWGPYFHCMNCGNVSFKKGLEMNPQVKDNQKKKTERKEITIRSDELDFLY